MLLAFDTASAAVGVALLTPEGVVVAEQSTPPSLRHAELLAPLIHEVLGEAELAPSALTRIVVGVGPGPFTGLRVGVVTARVMGATLGVPVDGVCSLDALAAGALRMASAQPPFVVATDARRREVYWARYEPDPAGWRRVAGPFVGSAQEAAGSGGPVVGRGAELYPGVLGSPCRPLDAAASDVAAVALAGRTVPAEPLYLRRPDAREPGERKRVLR